MGVNRYDIEPGTPVFVKCFVKSVTHDAVKGKFYTVCANPEDKWSSWDLPENRLYSTDKLLDLINPTTSKGGESNAGS